MTLPLRPWMRTGLAPALLVFALLAAGCSSGPRRPERDARGPRPTPTPMAGQQSFFDDRVLVEVRVDTDGQSDGPMRDIPRTPFRGGHIRPRPSGGPARMSATGEAAGMRGVPEALPRGEPPAWEFRAGPQIAPIGGRRPVTVRLRFTNHSDAPVELRIADFVSPLGNFAVRPEKLKLQPGESVETEPMASQLAGSTTETAATLVLRLGDKIEKQTVTVHAVPPPGNVSASAAPSAAK